jgi:hypothetical protein
MRRRLAGRAVGSFWEPIRGQMTVINDDRQSPLIQKACQFGDGNSASKINVFLDRAEIHVQTIHASPAKFLAT